MLRDVRNAISVIFLIVIFRCNLCVGSDRVSIHNCFYNWTFLSRVTAIFQLDITAIIFYRFSKSSKVESPFAPNVFEL